MSEPPAKQDGQAGFPATAARAAPGARRRHRSRAGGGPGSGRRHHRQPPAATVRASSYCAPICPIAFSPDGTRLAVDDTGPSGDHGHLYLWDLTRNRT